MLPVPVLVRRADALCIDALTGELAPGSTLRALGGVVLPSELGASGVARIVEAFQRWIAGYREHVELTHGYGTSRLRFTGPTPATRWASQLDALDAAARKAHGVAFASATPAQREQLVRTALADIRLDRMPSIADAQHVAVALLAYFYSSSEATDLCYQARIGKERCRPLAQAPVNPQVSE
jgi:hypothetical protein